MRARAPLNFAIVCLWYEESVFTVLLKCFTIMQRQPEQKFRADRIKERTMLKRSITMPSWACAKLLAFLPVLVKLVIDHALRLSLEKLSARDPREVCVIVRT